MSTSSTREPLRLRRIVSSAVIMATAATAAIVLTAIVGGRSPMWLVSAEPIDIAEGVSITPASGWTLGHRGPNWVALNNADGSAQLRVAIKRADAADVGAALQADMEEYVTPAGLGNMSYLTAPDTNALQSANFQQQAFIDYSADVPAADGPIPVLGTFTELLNTSTQRSAFIDFRQNNNATAQAVDDGGMMIRSME